MSFTSNYKSQNNTFKDILKIQLKLYVVFPKLIQELIEIIIAYIPITTYTLIASEDYDNSYTGCVYTDLKDIVFVMLEHINKTIVERYLNKNIYFISNSSTYTYCTQSKKWPFTEYIHKIDDKKHLVDFKEYKICECILNSKIGISETNSITLWENCLYDNNENKIILDYEPLNIFFEQLKNINDKYPDTQLIKYFDYDILYDLDFNIKL